MLDPWQLKFTENGNSTEAPMTIDHMVGFFKQQHIHYNACQASQNRVHGGYGGCAYDNHQFQHHNTPGHGGYDNHYGNQYCNNTPNHFNHGGGGHSPGCHTHMYYALILPQQKNIHDISLSILL